MFQTVNFGLIAAMMMLPMVTVDIEQVPQENENLEATMDMMKKTNNLCAERVNEVVDDFVRWNLI
jgi:hypothetical protein